MYNIKGGGEWYDASYHGILVHRNYEEKTVKAKILKVKFQNLGENGAEAHFKWEPRSGCFVPHVLARWLMMSKCLGINECWSKKKVNILAPEWTS